jgi:hypothetical protein
LLLHALDVVVSAFWVMPTAAISIATASLEEICLSELIQWLSWTASRRPSDLGVDLIIEIFGDLLFTSRLIVNTAGGSEELLQLDSSNEVLVLGCHKAIVLAQEEYLVVPLRSLGFLCEV